MGLDILGYVVQAARWRLLLRGKGNLSLLRVTQAIYVGLFANEILPLRIGELVRGYLVSRWVSRDFLSIFPSVAVERLFDSVWLAVLIGLSAFLVPLPDRLLESEKILGAIVLLGTGLFLYLVLREEKKLEDESAGSVYLLKYPSLWKPLRIAKNFVDRFALEMKEIGLTRYFYASFGISIFVIIFEIFAFWLIMYAFNLDLPFTVGAVVFLIVHLGTAVPNAPGNVGTYQFFTVVGLSLFGVDKTVAAGFSVAVFVILSIPLISLGLIAFIHAGIPLTRIRSDINRVILRMKTSRTPSGTE
jgi:glycosyltransferase 2 family protein